MEANEVLLTEAGKKSIALIFSSDFPLDAVVNWMLTNLALLSQMLSMELVPPININALTIALNVLID